MTGRKGSARQCRDALASATIPHAVPAAALYRRCDRAELPFSTTRELADLDEIVGQDRATEAIDLAVRSVARGFDLFALGPPGTGKATALRQVLASRAAAEPAPDDWCYVHDFDDPRRPRALRLPAGTAGTLRDAMTQLTLELQGAIPAAFESEAYRTAKDAIEADLAARRDAALAEVEGHAQAAGVSLIRTPIGLGFAPVKDGQVIDPETFKQLPPAEQQRIHDAIVGLEGELQAVHRQLPQWQREVRRRVREADREAVTTAVHHLIDELRHRFEHLAVVLAHLDRVEADIVARAPEFVAAAAQADGAIDVPAAGHDGGPFRRYRVNAFVQHDPDGGAPIVVEDHPTYANLVGRTEYVSQLGTLVTDFTLIRPGALHRANGGYLVLEADKVLLEPYAWEELKRAMRTREVRVEALGQSLGLLTTATLEPEPIPLDVKVALLGDRRLYYLLCAYDREFLELFKVAADFEDDVDRTPQRTLEYARLVATLARREGLRPLTASAVARTIEHLARLAGDATKLSTHMGRLSDVLREADQVAGERGRAVVTRTDVEHALVARVRRASRLYERLQEAIERATIRIELDGTRVGQVNALSVMVLGDEPFGHPSRVTATARMGRGEVIDIEREVELGGPLHSKGVLILGGFLAGRYRSTPLTLHASLVFEQTYGGVEGDSASLAELCALLSAIADVPLRQDLAVTGSIDQYGNVQAIGGVNEKIEGFFDACVARGLTGRQGVVIPAANVTHLMLATRVRRAARAGQFRIHPVATVDEALALLAGRPAGQPLPDGRYPAGSVNGRVVATLERFAETAARFAIPATGDGAASGAEPRRPRARARGS